MFLETCRYTSTVRIDHRRVVCLEDAKERHRSGGTTLQNSAALLHMKHTQRGRGSSSGVGGQGSWRGGERERRVHAAKCGLGLSTTAYF